jgi:hypothetical protein
LIGEVFRWLAGRPIEPAARLSDSIDADYFFIAS